MVEQPNPGAAQLAHQSSGTELDAVAMISDPALLIGELVDEGEPAGFITIDRQSWIFSRGALWRKRKTVENLTRWRAIFTLINDHGEGFADDLQIEDFSNNRFRKDGILYTIYWLSGRAAEGAYGEWFSEWR